MRPDILLTRWQRTKDTSPFFSWKLFKDFFFLILFFSQIFCAQFLPNNPRENVGGESLLSQQVCVPPRQQAGQKRDPKQQHSKKPTYIAAILFSPSFPVFQWGCVAAIKENETNLYCFFEEGDAPPNPIQHALSHRFLFAVNWMLSSTLPSFFILNYSTFFFISWKQLKISIDFFADSPFFFPSYFVVYLRYDSDCLFNRNVHPHGWLINNKNAWLVRNIAKVYIKSQTNCELQTGQRFFKCCMTDCAVI